MANLTSSSIDDQQERHFIGDLLSEEDVFGQPNGTRIEGSASSRLSTGGVLPSSGPLGPSPNQTYWPEPPPPYSPYTVGPPQWPSMNHQPPAGLLAPPVATLFGQSPTATAVTRTDFYQAPFNGPGEWDPVTGAPIDAYLQVGSGISYSPHTGLPRAAPPGMTQGYAGMEPNPLLHVDTMHTQRSAPRTLVKKQNSVTIPYGDGAVSPNCAQQPGGGGTVPPPGKSYRDAASKKQRVAPSSTSPVLANTVGQGAVRHTSSSSSGGTPQLIARKITPSQRTLSGRHSSGDSLLDGHHAALNGSGSLETGEKHRSSAGVIEGGKAANANGRRVTENEFQKITHKKSKGCKGGKSEQIIADEDGPCNWCIPGSIKLKGLVVSFFAGLAGSQAVDASSRFDVLQSLGSQSATSLLQQSNSSSSRRSRSSGVAQHDSPIAGSKATKGNVAPGGQHDQQDGDSQLTKGVHGGELFNGRTTDDLRTNAAATKVNALSQRSVAKKIGTRRELSEQNIVDSQRTGTRKQRAAARKRHNTAFDYLNLIVLAVLSLLKRAAQWIADLVIDISLQLKDITVYAALATYTSVTVSCQRSWYSSWDRLRLLWNNICSFNARKLWASEENERGEWGLSDNIQLPTTGDEAMERLLRCHGQDAYVVLGLRADCSDEDIKRYYKRQAVLVHPDKNHSNGADEAFKILSRAFDAIGTPEARLKYNLANLHKNPLHKEMEELWERLREKMNETRNTMHCDCGSKHARVPVEGIRACEARYCKKCRIRHPAKHNDIWAETRCGGFWWVYYACLDGVVYDITQWATCPNNRLKHMKANSHAVQYRLISTTGPLANKSDSSSSRHNKKSQQQQETDELDYLSGCAFGGGAEIGCGCPMPMGCGSGLGAGASQQASYRPPDRRALDGDRPRRAGRRRKLSAFGLTHDKRWLYRSEGHCDGSGCVAPSLSFGFDDAHFDVGPRAESVLVGSLMALCEYLCTVSVRSADGLKGSLAKGTSIMGGGKGMLAM
uniref:J domain-containing protein n=1 Tax=Ascaris lumbricoides TaxID=6252 RepID=A0A9J2PAM1_ASCLU